jgi:ribosomal protein S18 acetylase RimI-like enzyme
MTSAKSLLVMAIPTKSRTSTPPSPRAALSPRRVALREPVEVRSPTLSDAGALAELLEQLGYPCTEEQVVSRLAALPSPGQPLVLVADLWLGTHQKVVAGLLAVELGCYFHRDARHAHVTALVADRRYRHRGVARALITEAQGLARRAGCQVMHLRTSRSRDDAHSFYRALGFDETHLTFDKAL